MMNSSVKHVRDIRSAEAVHHIDESFDKEKICGPKSNYTQDTYARNVKDTKITVQKNQMVEKYRNLSRFLDAEVNDFHRERCSRNAKESVLRCCLLEMIPTTVEEEEEMMKQAIELSKQQRFIEKLQNMQL